MSRKVLRFQTACIRNGDMSTSITAVEVENAIKAIMSGGQRVQVGDRIYEAANLRDLQKMLQEVSAAERSAAGTLFTRCRFGTIR